MNNNIYADLYGNNLAEVMAKVKFVEQRPAASSSHVVREEVVIAYPLKDPETIAQALKTYTDYFEEIVSKLRDQAVYLFPGNIFITDDIVEDAVDRLRVLLKKAITGDSRYAPFMHDGPVDFNELQKAIFIGIVMFINKPDKINPHRCLFWTVRAEPFKFKQNRSEGIERFEAIDNDSATQGIIEKKLSQG